MQRNISGKNFSKGGCNDVVFEWDDNVSIPLMPSSSNTQPGNVQGQKIDLYSLSRAEKNVTGPQSVPSRHVPPKKRTTTPPPTRVSTKATSQDSKKVPKSNYGGDIHRPVHHIPGSTVPHLRTGSKRTQDAAHWLAAEQSKKRKEMEDRNRQRERARKLEEERRKRLRSKAERDQDSDMQRVHDGKEPIHNVQLLHTSSLCGPHKGRVGVNVADRPFFPSSDPTRSRGRSSADGSSLGAGGSGHALSRPPVPRLSKVVIRTSNSHQSKDLSKGAASSEPVPPEDQEVEYDSDGSEVLRVDKDLLAKYASSKGTPLPADLPSPGVEIRLRETFLSNASSDEGDFGGFEDGDDGADADDDAAGRGGGGNDEYGEDSDFEETPQATSEELQEGAHTATVEVSGDPLKERLVGEGDDDDNYSDDEGGGLRSVGNMSGTTTDSKLKRREVARAYLEQRRRKEALLVREKKLSQQAVEEEKKRRLVELDAERKAQLRKAVKLKSIPVHTSTQRLPRRGAPAVLQPPTYGDSYSEPDMQHHIGGVSVYGRDLSPKGEMHRVAGEQHPASVGHVSAGDLNWALDDALIGDSTLALPPRLDAGRGGEIGDRPPSRRLVQGADASMSLPQNRGNYRNDPMDNNGANQHRKNERDGEEEDSEDSVVENEEKGEYFDLAGHSYTHTHPSHSQRGNATHQQQGRRRPRSAHSTSRSGRSARSNVPTNNRQRSRSAGSSGPVIGQLKRPFCAGSRGTGLGGSAPSSASRRSNLSSKGPVRNGQVPAATDDPSNRSRRQEHRKPEIPHHVFRSQRRHRSSADPKDSDKENIRDSRSSRRSRAGHTKSRGSGGSDALSVKKNARGGSDSGGGSSNDMNTHVVDLLNDHSEAVFTQQQQLQRSREKPLHPIQQYDDSELFRSVKDIMENRFRGNESDSQLRTSSDRIHSLKNGSVMAQVDRNEDAASQLLQSMERLRREVSANIQSFAEVRESAEEIGALRSSLQSRLSLAASVDSEASGVPPSPPSDDSESGDDDDDDDDDETWDDKMDTVRFDDRSEDRHRYRDDEQSEPDSEGSHEPRGPHQQQRNSRNQDFPEYHRASPSEDFERAASGRLTATSTIDYGDAMMSQQMGMLQDKREILARYLGEDGLRDSTDEYPTGYVGNSGDELVWGGSAYKIENVGGSERLVKAKAAPSSRSSNAPLSLRNVGELAGVLDATGNSRRDVSDYGDSSDGSDDDENSEEDHRIVSIFANEIYRQRLNEALDKEKEDMKRMLVEETHQRATSEIEKDRARSPSPTKRNFDSPSMYVSPAESSPRGGGSAIGDDRSISPRTYWDTMISRSTLPSPPKGVSNADERLPSVSEETSRASPEVSPGRQRSQRISDLEREYSGEKRVSDERPSSPPRYSGAELRLMLNDALHKQENLFNIAIDLGEVTQTQTIQTASQAMQEIVVQADKDAIALQHNHQLAQMQHAYEMSLATTTAEASLVAQRELAARDAALAELNMQVHRQSVDQEHANFLANTIQNVDLASELFDMRQMASEADRQRAIAEQVHSAAASSQPEHAHSISTGTMTDEEKPMMTAPSSSQSAQSSSIKSSRNEPVAADVGDDDEYDEYTASFDEESRVFNRSAVRFNTAASAGEVSIATEVNDDIPGGAGDDYEYSFVEESFVAPSPTKLDKSVESQGEVSESMLEVSAASEQDYSEDFADQTALSMASVSVKSRGAKPPMPPVSASSSSLSEAELFGQYMAEIDNRIRSQEKSIAMRLQLEKKKMEHEQQLLKKRQQDPKTSLSKQDYAEGLRSIENDYNSSVADLERERWTMNARAYKERKKYEQLRKDMNISYSGIPLVDNKSKPPPGPSSLPTSKAAIAALEASDSYDNSFESAGKSISRFGPRGQQQNVSVSFESYTRDVEESFASVVSEYAPEEPSQHLSLSYAQDDFEEEEDEDRLDRSADEYSSEVFEALSFVDPTTKPPTHNSAQKNVSINSPSKKSSIPSRSQLVFKEDDTDVPSLEELQRRSRALQDKRAEAGDIIRRRTEEIERRKELIRIEEEEREVERLLQQARRLDVERELEDHRKVARLEAKKNVHAAYGQSNIDATRTHKKSSVKENKPHEKAPAKKNRSPAKKKQLDKSILSAKSVDSEDPYGQSDFEPLDDDAEDDVQDEIYFSPEDDEDEYSVDTEVDKEDTEAEVEEEEEDHVPEVSDVMDDSSGSEEVYDELSQSHSDHDLKRRPHQASASYLGISYADDFEVEDADDGDHEPTTSHKKLEVSRNLSTEYLSDFEETMDATDRRADDAEREKVKMRYQESQSSDTFAELDESLDRRNERILELKRKIEKAQTENKLEKLKAKQAERERLQREEDELVRLLESEKEAYRMEKERILKGQPVSEDADDAVVNKLIDSLHAPIREEDELLDDENALAEDSFSSSTALDTSITDEDSKFQGQVATRVREIEAAEKIQALERARQAKKLAEKVREDRKAFAIEGDLVKEYKRTQVAHELVMEDSFGSDSSEFSLEEEASAANSKNNEIAEREAELMAMEVTAKDLQKVIDEQKKLSLVIETDLPSSESPTVGSSSGILDQTPGEDVIDSDKANWNAEDINDSDEEEEEEEQEDVDREVEKFTDLMPPHQPHVLAPEISDLTSSSTSPRGADSSVSPLTLSPRAGSTPTSPPGSTSMTKDISNSTQEDAVPSTPEVDSEVESDIDEIYPPDESSDVDVNQSVNQSLLSAAEEGSLSMSPARGKEDDHLANTAGSDLGESGKDTVVWGSGSKKRSEKATSGVMEALQPHESDDDHSGDSVRNRLASVDETLDTGRSVGTLETNATLDTYEDIADLTDAQDEEALPDHPPVLASIESELTQLVRTTGKTASPPLAIPEEVSEAAGEEEGDDDDYGSYDDEFESAEETSGLAAADKSSIMTDEVEEDEIIEEEEEVSIGEYANSEKGALDAQDDTKDAADDSDWFEESNQQMEDENDLNRTFDSLGVDVVEEVRSPPRGQQASITPDGAVEELSAVDKIADLMADRSPNEAYALANEVTDILMQRLLASAVSSPAVAEAMLSKELPLEQSESKAAMPQDEVSVASTASVAESIEEDVEEDDFDNVSATSSTDERNVSQGPDKKGERDMDESAAKEESTTPQIVVPTDDDDYSFEDYEEDVVTEEVDIEQEKEEPVVKEDDISEKDTPLQETELLEKEEKSSSLSTLGGLPSLGGAPPIHQKPRGGGSSQRDSTLDDLLGDDDDDEEVDTSSAMSPRFGLPARARESDAFADTSIEKKPETVNEMWDRRKKTYVEELFTYIDGPVLESLLQDLGNSDFDVQEDTLLSEEVFFNIELQRVQNSTSESDIDADGVSQEVTQMNHKVVFDRVNEVLSELHLQRHSEKGCGPPAPYNKRMIAKSLPLDKAHLIPLLKSRLFPPVPKPTIVTLEDGSSLVQPRSSLDSIKVPTLDNLRDEVQTTLMDTAEYITDMILTRMLVEVTNIVIKTNATS